MQEKIQPQPILTSSAPLPIGPYSQAILHAGLVFCSGQLGLDLETGSLAGVSASDQTEAALRHLGEVLRAAGADFAGVVKTTVFLIDMNDFASVNTVYSQYFEGSKPARSTIAVAALPKGARVEIEAIAVSAR